MFDLLGLQPEGDFDENGDIIGIESDPFIDPGLLVGVISATKNVIAVSGKLGGKCLINITSKTGTKLLPQFDSSLIGNVVSSSTRIKGQATEGAKAIAKKLGHAQSGGYESAFKGIKPT